jgi:hypothetical protein
MLITYGRLVSEEEEVESGDQEVEDVAAHLVAVGNLSAAIH